MNSSNDFTISLTLFIALVFVAILSFRNHFKTRDKIQPHRLPWMIICLGSIATSFMLLVHIVNLLGFETGGRF